MNLCIMVGNIYVRVTSSKVKGDFQLGLGQLPIRVKVTSHKGQDNFQLVAFENPQSQTKI